MGEAAPDGSWMNPAISGVDALIGRVNAALGRVSALSAASSEAAQRQFDRDNQVYSGRGGDPRQFMGNGPSVFVPNEDVGTGGGGGGGTDPYADNLTRLIESLQTERETVDAWYNENLSILNDRRAMEILGEQGHKDALLDLEREHQEKLAGIKAEGNQWSLQSALEGGAEIFGAMGAMNKKFLKAQSIFSAGAALISTYQGAAKELEKGTLGFGTAAAVIAKGIGFVAAIKSAGSGSTSASGGGSASATTSATSATRAEPERVTRVELQGEDWLVSLAETMMTQIYDASKNGRVIVARA